MNKIITQSLVTVAMLSTLAVADEEVANEVVLSDVEAQYSAKSSVEATDELKQTINLGFSNTSGNTDTSNLNGKYTMAFTTVGYAEEKLKVGFDATAFVNKNDDVKSNEEYTANLGLEQYITNGRLGYTALNWLRNPDFKNVDNKISVGAGLGKEIYNDGQHTLKLKVGMAYNIEQYADATPEAKYTSVNEYIEYTNILNETSTLFLKVGAMQNIEDFENDYEILGVAGLNFSVAENISLTIEEEIRYDKIHPGTKESKDTKTIVRVGYNF